LEAQGSYFLMTDFAGQEYPSDAAFCRWLIREIGVAAIPPSAFYLEPATVPRLVRFCFAKERATIEEAGRRLVRMPDRRSVAGGS
jgi:aspartate/methionine/tyrosine aminotransferase